MRKLIKGIIEFRRLHRDSKKDLFAKLALGQKPDALFIACSDSRVAVNVFASTDPGDLFVVRNVGNMVARCDDKGLFPVDESEGAALEFAIEKLGVKNIIICGHSDCGAINALCSGRLKINSPHLRSWLRHGEDALDAVRSEKKHAPGSREEMDEVSKRNVVLQMEHLMSYPALRQGTMALHGLWFDIRNADVYYYENDAFILLDDQEGERILSRLSS